MRYKVVSGVVLSAVLAVQVFAQRNPVDPRFPYSLENTEGIRLEIPSGSLPHSILYLEGERTRLQNEIARLPQHAPRALSDHLGYHSLPLNDTGVGGESREIEVQFEFDTGLGAIALVPALVPGSSGSYAFPKRFKIEVLDRGGKWVGGKDGKWMIPEPPYSWLEVVNWMSEDFPDPGPYPVFFMMQKNIRIHRMKITFSSAEESAAFYALGEVYLFRDPDHSPRLGDNMMTWDTVSVQGKGTLSKPPLWDAAYLNDGIVGLGMPLSEEVTDVDDFMVTWDESDPDDGDVQIILDLGKTQPIGRVQLWPAKAPHGMAVSHFGFPGKVGVEISTDPDFNAAMRFDVNDIRDHLYTDNVLNVITQAEKARYIRISLGDLDAYMGQKMLGLGEIRVSEFDEVWSLECAISAKGLPRAGKEQLPRLVDGFSRSRRILREVEWIRGLALRRPLDRQLKAVEAELQLAREAWAEMKVRLGILGGITICFALIAAMGLQRLQRRHVLKRLKHRITRDLHDEVGSSLGGITLAARRMEDAGATQKDLTELSLMAREASAALKDVVWVLDQSRIRLPELLKKLAERAERVLVGMELVVSLPDPCPDRVVPLPFKRHLLMFFKEAVHNCARHSKATEVELAIFVQDDMLTVRIHDNGVGFDPDAIRDGWGVDSMGKRAKELGGRMELISEPGKGTTVQLSVPLSALLHKTDHTYKTSN